MATAGIASPGVLLHMGSMRKSGGEGSCCVAPLRNFVKTSGGTVIPLLQSLFGRPETRAIRAILRKFVSFTGIEILNALLLAVWIIGIVEIDVSDL